MLHYIVNIQSAVRRGARDAFFRGESAASGKTDPSSVRERDSDSSADGKPAMMHSSIGLVPKPALRDVENYIGFASLPNQVYRKSVKRGFEFTLMVVGKLLILRYSAKLL